MIASLFILFYFDLFCFYANIYCSQYLWVDVEDVITVLHKVCYIDLPPLLTLPW